MDITPDPNLREVGTTTIGITFGRDHKWLALIASTMLPMTWGLCPESPLNPRARWRVFPRLTPAEAQAPRAFSAATSRSASTLLMRAMFCSSWSETDSSSDSVACAGTPSASA